MVLDCPTWKAHPYWACDLHTIEDELAAANHDSVRFADNAGPVVLNALFGPRGDAHAPADEVAADEAQAVRATHLEWVVQPNYC